MNLLNVNRNVDDPFYRYKMPTLCAKQEGKGNGVRTVIANICEISKAIQRPAAYMTKYFGYELCAQTQIDLKHERYIVNGTHDATKLQRLLNEFIEKFVLCQSCGNPETNLLAASRKDIISQRCKACGFCGPLSSNHKLNTFISKNILHSNTCSSTLPKTKSKRRSKKSDSDDGSESANKSCISLTIETKVPVESTDEQNYNNSNENWSADFSETGIRQRKQELSVRGRNLALNTNSRYDEKNHVDMFYEYVRMQRDKNYLENISNQACKELVKEAHRLDIFEKATLVFVELFFSTNIVSEIRKYRKLLLHFTHGNLKAQKYLLNGVEQVITNHSEKLLPKVAGILKLLYDTDILEEQAILKWSRKSSNRFISKDANIKIHRQAEPFINWLKEAEEEEDEEDDSESCPSSEDHHATVGVNVSKNYQQFNYNDKGAHDGDEDIDIDSI